MPRMEWNDNLVSILILKQYPGAVWRIVAQSGSVLMTQSLAPPAAIYISTNRYHYTKCVTRGISISVLACRLYWIFCYCKQRHRNGLHFNFCYYPSVIVQSFDTALCIYDQLITVNSTSDRPGGTFNYLITNTTTNQTYATNVINPAELGVGVYNL